MWFISLGEKVRNAATIIWHLFVVTRLMLNSASSLLLPAAVSRPFYSCCFISPVISWAYLSTNYTLGEQFVPAGYHVEPDGFEAWCISKRWCSREVCDCSSLSHDVVQLCFLPPQAAAERERSWACWKGAECPMVIGSEWETDVFLYQFLS